MTGSGTRSAMWPEPACMGALVTFDVDAESGMLWAFPGASHYLDVMCHQAYGIRTGLPRILQALARRDFQTTFFVPGWVAERWPDSVKKIRDCGHEVAHHGYLHEKIHGMPPQRELDILRRGIDAIERLLGERPQGYRAPGFELNSCSPSLLHRLGFRYDSSLQDSDYPYLLSTTPDGSGSTIVELPVQYALDDWSHYMTLPSAQLAAPIADPKHVLDMWIRELEALHELGGLFNVTAHPILSGRASRLQTILTVIDRAIDDDTIWTGRAIDLVTDLEHSGMEVVANLPPVVSNADPEPPASSC